VCTISCFFFCSSVCHNVTKGSRNEFNLQVLFFMLFFSHLYLITHIFLEMKDKTGEYKKVCLYCHDDDNGTWSLIGIQWGVTQRKETWNGMHNKKVRVRWCLLIHPLAFAQKHVRKRKVLCRKIEFLIFFSFICFLQLSWEQNILCSLCSDILKRNLGAGTCLLEFLFGRQSYVSEVRPWLKWAVWELIVKLFKSYMSTTEEM